MQWIQIILIFSRNSIYVNLKLIIFGKKIKDAAIFDQNIIPS